MNFFVGLGILLASVATITALTFWSEGLNLAMKKTFGVASVNADRKIFEESQPYNEGMIRDLENLQRQYVTATPEQKATLKALTLHRFSVYPEEKLPANLASFYEQLRGGSL